MSTTISYIKASNTDNSDGFGTSVSIYNDVFVVGAPQEDSGSTGVNGDQGNPGTADLSGAAYVFRYNNFTKQWAQESYLKASNTGPGDKFGKSCSIYNNVIVIGAEYDNSGATGVNGDGGATGTDYAGGAHIYRYNELSKEWAHEAYLKASNADASDLFGASITNYGNIAVVGAPLEKGGDTGINGDQTSNIGVETGAVYVYRYNGSVWEYESYIKASNPVINSIRFGWSIGSYENRLVVGAPFERSGATGVNGDQSDVSANNAGAAYVFKYNGNVWTQEAYLKASNTEASDQFGRSVSIHNNVIAVGAPFEPGGSTGINGNQSDNSKPASGAVYVYRYNGNEWIYEAYLKASNSNTNYLFGSSVNVGNNMILVGAYLENGGATGLNGDQTPVSALSGASYLFRYNTITNMWYQDLYIKATNLGGNDSFGTSVAIGDKFAVIGALGEDSGATGINGPYNDSVLNSGAAYVYNLPQEINFHWHALPPTET